MSSLARRSLRTTVTAAGIAAVGAGLAFPAVAAPELPAPAAPGVPAAPSADAINVPGVVNFEMPTVNTAGPELPAGDAFALPTAPEFAAPAAPAVPGADDSVDVDGDLDRVDGPAPDDPAQNRVGALPAMDMAQLVMELAQDAAAGESVTEHRQIG